MFCQKCGSKTIDGAEFCQKCGAKLITNNAETTQSANMPAKTESATKTGTEPSGNPVSVTKVTSNECIIEEKPIKKKNKNIPLLIVVLVVLVLILACIIMSGSESRSLTESAGTDSENSSAKTTIDEIRLTQTFNDMGISFNYPNNWTILDDGNDYTIVYMLDSNNNADHRITFTVSMIFDDDPMNVFSGNEAAVCEAVNQNMTYMEYKDSALGEYPAKYLKYQTDGLKSTDISENYFYRIGTEGYRINCTYTASDEETYRPLFETIISGFTVNADVSTVQGISSENEDDMIRSAYSEKVRELASEDSDMTFSLIDLTADDVYELVADKSGYYVNIYAYDDGSVVPIIEEWGYGAGGNYGYEYLPSKNIICNTSLQGAGREMYTKYMCVDSDHKVQYAYDDVLCYIYPSSYYYGEREIYEYEYNNYQITGEFSMIKGLMGAAQMTAQLSEGINIRSSYDREITFNGVPISSFIGVPINSITYWWGKPLEYNEGGGVNYCKYDGIYFEFDYIGKIYSVGIAPEMCSVDGKTLGTNRDGIVSILGIPSDEEWGETGYRVRYEYYPDNYSANFFMTSPDDISDSLWLSTNY